jgi:hypothetical protein
MCQGTVTCQKYFLWLQCCYFKLYSNVILLKVAYFINPFDTTDAHIHLLRLPYLELLKKLTTGKVGVHIM